MLISAKYNFVFLCMPKCASNSIEAMLKPYSDIACLGLAHFRHTNYRGYARYFKPYLQEAIDVDQLETVCLVRDPLSWLDSWHRFRSGNRYRAGGQPNHERSTVGISFSEFIEASVSPDPPPYAQVGSQFDFVKDGADQVGVDTLFRYENIDDFVAYISAKVGQDLTLPSLNVSPSKTYSSPIMNRADRLRRKIIRQFGLKGAAPVAKARPEISTALLEQLRVTMARDFALYESIAQIGSSAK